MKKNIIFLMGATVVVLFIWASGLSSIWINGIHYIAHNVEDYTLESYPIEGEYSIIIDLNNLESNEGKVLYNDGENQISIYEVSVRDQTVYEVYFKTSGTYNLFGATLVSAIKHTNSEGSFSYNFVANAKATYNGNTFKLYESGTTALNYRDGDYFGLYLIPESEEENIDIETNPLIEVKLSNLYMHKWIKN